MRVLVADSDQFVRTFVRRILRDDADFELVGEVGDAEVSLEAARKTDADVVVLNDVTCMNCESGLVTDLVCDVGVAVIFVASVSDGAAMWAGISEGVSAYLLRDRLREELGQGLAAAEAGGIFLSPPLARVLIDYMTYHVTPVSDGQGGFEIDRRLLPRERETLQRLVAGQSTEQIAAEMSVAASTVRTYVSRVLRKIHVGSRGEAIAMAYRTGYCSPTSGEAAVLRPLG